MRILIVSQQFKPIVGGYERAAERLAVELAAQGHEVTVLTERRNRKWPAHEELDGVVVRRLWCIHKRRWHMATSLVSFATFLLLHGRRFQVFHIQQYGTHAALVVAVARILSKPTILRTTSTRSGGIGQALGGKSPVARLVAALHRKVDACVVTTSWALDEVLRFGFPRGRIRLIPNGIDTGEMKPSEGARSDIRRRLLRSPDVVLAVYCGRLDEAKNPLGLVRAWQYVVSQVPTATLAMVGDGPQRGTVQQLVDKEGLGEHVILVGEQAAVLPWYQAADLFVLSSHREGLSNSLLEAMSCGLSVVSTEVSG
ncbi:MAG: glycosyltransferase family 4 protein, partial [Holophaga sp.]